MQFYSIFSLDRSCYCQSGACGANKFLFLKFEIVIYLFIFPLLQLSTAGGRIIVSSDGVWDALSAEIAFDCCRGMPPDSAASQIVKVFLQLVVFIFVLKRTLV